MKRILSALLLLGLLLSGCGRRGKLLVEPVHLYYPKAEYGHGAADSVIDYESIDGTGRMDDYEALLGEYFCDPVGESLVNPFPHGTRVLAAVLRGSEFRVRLTQEAAALPDAEFALACTCLAMTCFDIADCREVTIISSTRRLTVPQDSWLLLDDYIPEGITKK